VAQDTTEINFAGRDRGRKLGLGGDGASLGFFIHLLVAVDADDEALPGRRGGEDLDPCARRREDARPKRSLKDKESVRWVDAAQTAAQRLANAVSVVGVGDR
jgi:hypothetical protein